MRGIVPREPLLVDGRRDGQRTGFPGLPGLAWSRVPFGLSASEEELVVVSTAVRSREEVGEAFLPFSLPFTGLADDFLEASIASSV